MEERGEHSIIWKATSDDVSSNISIDDISDRLKEIQIVLEKTLLQNEMYENYIKRFNVKDEESSVTPEFNLRNVSMRRRTLGRGGLQDKVVRLNIKLICKVAQSEREALGIALKRLKIDAEAQIADLKAKTEANLISHLALEAARFQFDNYVTKTAETSVYDAVKSDAFERHILQRTQNLAASVYRMGSRNSSLRCELRRMKNQMTNQEDTVGLITPIDMEEIEIRCAKAINNLKAKQSEAFNTKRMLVAAKTGMSAAKRALLDEQERHQVEISKLALLNTVIERIRAVGFGVSAECVASEQLQVYLHQQKHLFRVPPVTSHIKLIQEERRIDKRKKFMDHHSETGKLVLDIHKKLWSRIKD